MAVASARRNRSAKASGTSGLVLIGFYKLLEGLLLVAAGIGALRLLHKDVSAVALHWVHVLRIDPDNRYIHRALEKTLSINPRQLKELSAGTFMYAALRLTEGIGLIYRMRWAEYLTIIATALFIPLEIYELIRRFTPLRIGLLALNVAIVWYLWRSLKRQRR